MALPRTTFSWMLLFIVKLNRNFHRAGDIQRSDARIYLPDDDNAGVRNLLAIIPIEDGHVTTRRPINQLANFVSVGSFSLFRNRTRQMSEFSLRNKSFIVSVSGSNETKARVVLLSINVAVITLSSTFSLIFILCAFSEDALVGKFGKAVSAMLLSAPQPP